MAMAAEEYLPGEDPAEKMDFRLDSGPAYKPVRMITIPVSAIWRWLHKLFGGGR